MRALCSSVIQEMIMKSITFILASFILVFINATTLLANPLPFQSMPSFIQYQDKFEPYYPMKCRLKRQKKILIGNYWHQKYRHPAAHDENKFYETLTSLNPNAKLEDKGHSIRVYSLKKGSNTYWIKVDFNGKWYDVKAILEKPYTPILKLDTPTPIRYAKNIQQTLPHHMLLPHVEGYHINRAQYQQFNQLELSYKDSHRKQIKQAVEGKHWKLTYQLIQKDSLNHRYQLSQNFIDEILRLGGKILKKKNSSVVFRIETTTGEVWGKASAYSSSLNIEFVEKEVFKQVLILSSDELKTELDNFGKVILSGIYFDTAKAVLKPQSQPAINTVVNLMKKYPELQIEVQGYTDSIGSVESNQLLSEERAAAIKNVIIEAGIPSSMIISKGFGESHPVASNETQEGRSKNRRVELHRISDNIQKTNITIDVIKPMPNAILIAKRAYKEHKFHFKIKSKNGKYRSKAFVANKMMYEYEFQAQDGKRLDTTSRLEVIKNHENLLKQLGATEMYTEKGSLFFQFKDRGDGVAIKGIVNAYNGNYNVNFYTMEDTKKSYVDHTPIKKTSTALPQQLIGKWVFDTTTSLQKTMSWKDRNTVLMFEKLTYDFKTDNTCILKDGSKGTVSMMENGHIKLQMTPTDHIIFELKENQLFATMPWRRSNKSIVPVFVKAKDAKPYILDIKPLIFATQYRSTKPVDGTYSYCMILKNGQMLFSPTPIERVTAELRHINTNRIINVNGSILVNGGMMTITPKDKGFELNNQGLKVTYNLFK